MKVNIDSHQVSDTRGESIHNTQKDSFLEYTGTPQECFQGTSSQKRARDPIHSKGKLN